MRYNIIIPILSFSFCFGYVLYVHNDMSTLKANNEILENALEQQKLAYSDLENTFKSLNEVNKKLQASIIEKNNAISKLKGNLLSAREKIIKDPKKYQNEFNERSRNYSKCIYDISIGKVNSKYCENFK